MTYILTVKDSNTNRIEHFRADDAIQAFDAGQKVIKQGNEIIDIKGTSTDDSPIGIDDIKQSLITKSYWAH